MCGWMDRCMDRWIDAWWIDVWMDRCMDGWQMTDRWLLIMPDSSVLTCFRYAAIAMTTDGTHTCSSVNDLNTPPPELQLQLWKAAGLKPVWEHSVLIWEGKCWVFYLAWEAGGFWLPPAPEAVEPAAGCAAAERPAWCPFAPVSCRSVSSERVLRKTDTSMKRKKSSKLLSLTRVTVVKIHVSFMWKRRRSDQQDRILSFGSSLKLEVTWPSVRRCTLIQKP